MSRAIVGPIKSLRRHHDHEPSARPELLQGPKSSHVWSFGHTDGNFISKGAPSIRRNDRGSFKESVSDTSAPKNVSYIFGLDSLLHDIMSILTSREEVTCLQTDEQSSMPKPNLSVSWGNQTLFAGPFEHSASNEVQFLARHT